MGETIKNFEFRISNFEFQMKGVLIYGESSGTTR